LVNQPINTMMILCTDALHLGHHTNKQLTLDDLTCFTVCIKFFCENSVCFEHQYLNCTDSELEPEIRTQSVA